MANEAKLNLTISFPVPNGEFVPSASLTAEGYFEVKLPPVVVTIWRVHVALRSQG
ncbi:MAG: hypothetical protein ACTS6A_02335 [Candidatus Hodgkinia cicadicola]